jgi:hypothetical protein
MGLVGCASGPKAPPPPSLPLAKVAVLTVGQYYTLSGDGAPFVGMSYGQVAPDPIARIVAAARAPFFSAVASVQFGPQAAFQDRLMPALLAKDLPVVVTDDFKLAEEVRAGNFKNVPGAFDAVLDVRVNAAGYYPASGAGGYSPMLYVVATLFSRAKPGEELMRFGYDADHRPAGGESRFFTTPKEISASSPDIIRQNAKLIRTEMDNIAARMVDRMVIDIGRRIRNEPPLP